MRFTIFQDSRKGDRDENEDRVGHTYSRDVLLMVIADGMGGHERGEVAAEIAVTEITRLFRIEARSRLPRPSEFLVSAIDAAHRAIAAHAAAQSLLESPRTTCVACVVQDGTAWWAHSGDSRLWVLRGGGLAAATRDHSRVQQLVDSGAITPQAAATHPDRNKVYSCLGGVVPPVISVGAGFALQTGDTVILATDGFWGQVSPDLVASRLRDEDIVRVLPGLLVEAARRAKGESDNLSVVAMTWEAQDDPRRADTVPPLESLPFAGASNTLDLGRPAATADTSDEEIERAIAEIRDAIRRVPR